MKIEQDENPVSSDTKRFYVPGLRITDRCKGCGADVECFETQDGYFEYPVLNGLEIVSFSCPDCEERLWSGPESTGPKDGEYDGNWTRHVCLRIVVGEE